MPASYSTINKHRLYQRVADELAEDIRQGLYPPGKKIPSVRKLSEKRSVSISTVTQAYSMLEDRGLIQARPQSGYFVREGIDQTEVAPPISQGEEPREITKGALIRTMLESSQQTSTINLGASIPDTSLLPHRAIQNHLQKAARFQSREAINYQFTPGYEPLRKQIAKRMRNIGVRCHHDEILITNGCTEALSLCLRTLCNSGDTVAVESPCYYGFLQIAETLGLKVIEIPTDPIVGMSIEALELALQQWSVSLVLLNSRCSNPTGSTMPAEKQEKLVKLLERYDIHAIEDDIYGELGEQVTTLKTFDKHGRVLYCSSFSKTVAPGLRVGWCLPGQHLERVKSLQTFTTLAIGSVSQCAMSSYLENGHYDKHLRGLKSVTRENLEKFSARIRDSFPAGTLLSPPNGGALLWVCLPGKINARKLQQKALSRGISIVPGDVFSNTEHFSHYIRVNCALPWGQAVKDAIVELGKLAASMR